MIENTSGKQIKNLIALINKRKTRNEQGLFVAEGVRILSEAFVDKIDRIYVSETFLSNWQKEEYYERIKNILDTKGYEILADKVFDQIADTKTPQGIMAVLKMPQYHIENLIEKSGDVLFLDDVRDPGNLGTIIRTAEGAGFDFIVMSKGCVDIYNPKVIRATMGAIYRLPFVYVDDLCETINAFVKDEWEIYAAHLLGKEDYCSINYGEKTGIIIGNEANGISEKVSQCATSLVRIPMEGKVESLNAAVAAAIMMYEVHRQKNKTL